MFCVCVCVVSVCVQVIMKKTGLPISLLQEKSKVIHTYEGCMCVCVDGGAKSTV